MFPISDSVYAATMQDRGRRLASMMHDHALDDRHRWLLLPSYLADDPRAAAPARHVPIHAVAASARLQTGGVELGR